MTTQAYSLYQQFLVGIFPNIIKLSIALQIIIIQNEVVNVPINLVVATDSHDTLIKETHALCLTS